MNETRKNSEKPTRRQFIRRTAAGASLLGLGGASGLLTSTSHSSPTVPLAKAGRTLGKDFTYDLSALTKVDPKLIQYTETAQIPTGFTEVRGLAITSDDQIFVAGDQAVRIFSKQGERLGCIEMNDRPRCLALGRNGYLYVGTAKRVEVLTLKGERQATWESLGENAIITSIAVAEKDVFVADAGNRVVVRFDTAGKKLGLIGKKNPAKDILGFVVPSPYFEVGVGADGLLWAVNPAHHRLEAFNFDGELQSAWGESANAIHGFCGCCNPIHFTRLRDGRFVTSEKGLPRVKIYSASGNFECVVAAPELFPEQLQNPKAAKACMGLGVNSSGQILLADANMRALRIFSPKPTS